MHLPNPYKINPHIPFKRTAPPGAQSNYDVKHQKTAKSALEQRIASLEAEAESELKILQYEQFREAKHDLDVLKAQGWNFDGDRVENIDLKATLYGSACVKWWLNKEDREQAMMVRSCPEFSNDAGFYDLFYEVLCDVARCLQIYQNLNDMDQRDPEKCRKSITDELVEVQKYFDENKHPAYHI